MFHHISHEILGNVVGPSGAGNKQLIVIRRRFQFSSALKRMSTLSSLPGGKTLAAVKGAPETIKTMLSSVPDHYDETYKWFTRNGSRVLALGVKEMEPMSVDKVRSLFDRPVALTNTTRTDQQISSRASRKRPHLCRFPSLPLSLEIRRG